MATTDVCCVLFLVCLYICVCEYLPRNKVAGLPSGFLSTAPPPVCVSAVLGTLVVWIPTQKKTILAVLGTVAVWIPNQKKKASAVLGLLAV